MNQEEHEMMTMKLIGGVLVRSDWLADDDDRLERGVDTANQLAEGYGFEVKWADIDPVEGDVGTLRIHAEGEGQGFISFTPLRDEGGVVQNQVYRFPVFSSDAVRQLLEEQPDIPDEVRERLIREFEEGRGSGER